MEAVDITENVKELEENNQTKHFSPLQFSLDTTLLNGNMIHFPHVFKVRLPFVLAQ